MTGEEEVPAPAHADETPAEDRTTVLVVDDNPDVRAYVRSVLAATYRVLEAADGRAGLDRAREALPDLVVADVMMPELDGLAMARALKGDAMTDAIPVVLLTARAAPADQVAGYKTGADAYLVKPFDPAVLEACVANLLTQRQRLRARFQAGEERPPAPATPTVAEPSALERRLRAIVEARLTDDALGPETLAEAAGLSYHQLYRALHELDTTPSRFIRGVRVECARELLQRRSGSVTEIAYSVGFESLSYFSRAYHERFGVAPSAHLGGAASVAASD
jgi:DNA-binding response OmpR family regulator